LVFSAKVTRVSGETGIIRYRYDAGGRLIYQKDEKAGEEAEYRYDGAGRRVRMRSGNRDVQYGYGKNGEVVKVSDNSQRLYVEYQYDEIGREVMRRYGNGVKQETQYDAIGRTVVIKETNVRGEITRAEGYVYDEQGRRSHSVDEAGRITKYEYDGQSRLSTVLYPYSEEKAESDRKEAEEAGLYFTLDKGQGERYSYKSEELSRVREVLNRVSINRGGLVNAHQIAWRETYTYDGNGNRASKTTPWGVIKYTYDAENRMVSRGDIKLTYDKDGNVVSEKGLRYEAKYEYNGQNRMTYSETAKAGGRKTISRYAYDGLGRRTVEREDGGETMRTLYDGLGFEEIRRGVTFVDGSFTTRYATGIVRPAEKRDEGIRYRWLGPDTESGIDEDAGTAAVRYTRIQAVLYSRGEAVGMNRTASTGSRSGSPPQGGARSRAEAGGGAGVTAAMRLAAGRGVAERSGG
jgi:YD repeat-containing protein